MKIYKHLFFDLDNTLWDFKANSRDAFRQVFDELSLNKLIPDFEKFLAVYEVYNEQLWEEYRNGNIKKNIMRNERTRLAFLDMGVDDPTLAAEAGELYIHIAPRMSNLFEDVHEVLDYLQQKYKLYILTNGFIEIQVQKLKNSGLQEYFTKLFMAEMVGYQKPDRRFFEYAVKSIHAHKYECLMVGDDAGADISGAKNAGIDQVYFNPLKKDIEVDATYEIAAIRELMEIL